jgi:hypothetical protein
MQRDTNSFVLLGQYLWVRIVAPLDQFSFWAYLVVAIVGTGALGVWVELIRYLDNQSAKQIDALITAIFTFFPALACASSMQLVFGPLEKHVRSFAIVSMALLTLLGVVNLMGRLGHTSAIIFGVLACFFSIFLWWIANALNTELRDRPFTAAVGGNARTAPAGNIDDFNT